LVESALVYPLLFLLLLGTVILVLGVFRYMEVAALAREGCRWASVHGSQYAKDTGKPAATTSADVYNGVIASQAVGLDPRKLSCTVTWNPNPNDYHTILLENDVFPVSNTVRVTITYQWVPEAFFPPITLTSTAESIMSY
jgi:Flp pilus assembly protein TadG